MLLELGLACRADLQGKKKIDGEYIIVNFVTIFLHEMAEIVRISHFLAHCSSNTST